VSRIQTFSGIDVSQVAKLQLRILNFGLPLLIFDWWKCGKNTLH